MKIFEKSFKISASFIILIVLAILAGVSILFVIKTNNPIVLSIFGSLVAGLIVAIIQFTISLQDHKRTENYRKLGLISILYNRDDRRFYEDIIDKACCEICVMGVTAIRFFKDFADCDTSAPENAKVLLKKLEQGINVKILLPNIDFLEEEKKNDFSVVKQHILNLKTRLPESKLEIRYFEHTPSHSIFIVDDICIIGPVFPKVESKNTPALELKKYSPIAIKFSEYFQSEWNDAHE